ncbi:MAG: tetratricopeptide repeat protein [Candidatus Woesearchaeota archaeon]
MDPENNILWIKNRQAEALMENGQYEEVVYLIDRIFENNQERYYLHDTRGLACFYLGEYHAAVANFKKAIRLKPGLAKQHIHLYWACKRLAPEQPHRVEEGIKAVYSALELGIMDNSAPQEKENFLEDIILFCKEHEKDDDALQFFSKYSEIK